MKVVAQTAAFYNGQRVRPGAVVEVEDGFKALWAVPADTASSKATKGKGKEAPTKQEPTTLSQLGNEPGKPMAEVLA